MSKRILTGILSAILILTNLAPASMQVYASQGTDDVEVQSEIETETEESECVPESVEEVVEESLQNLSEETVSENEIENSGYKVKPEVEAVLQVEKPELSIEALNSDIVASGEYEDIKWTIDKNGHLKIEGTGEFAESEEDATWRYAPWLGYYTDQIITAEVKVEDMTDASAMFKGCYNLESIDVIGFDTSKVTNMDQMFNGCYALKTLDLSNFNTSNVTSMESMFYECRELMSLDVSKFNTAKVTDMSQMFALCSKLIDVDVSSFDTSNVTDMSQMFSSCENIKMLNVSKFNTAKVTDMSRMFDMCNQLITLDLSSFNTAKVTDMSEMFCCTNLTSLDVSSFDTSEVTCMAGMFYCPKLEILDVSNFETSQVTDMSGMFSSCENLVTLDVSGFDTSKVTNMNSMFSACVSLTQIDVSTWNVEKVTDFSWMFHQCWELKRIDMSGLEADSAVYVNSMVDSCLELEEVKLPAMISGNLINAFPIVSNCPKIDELDCSKMNLAGMSNGYYLFTGCPSLSKIYFPYNVSTPVALDIYGDDKWYLADKREVDSVPLNLSYSVVAMKNKVPEATEPYMNVSKNKISYYCGETLNVNDIFIQYFNKLGGVENVSTGFDTNVETINMFIPGKKVLIIEYNGLEAKIEIDVTYPIEEDTIGISLANNQYVYNGGMQRPDVQVVTEFGDVLIAGEDYIISYKNNIDAGGEATVIITGLNDYKGTVEKTFTILPAELVIRATDKICVLGEEVPAIEEYGYRITGLCGNDGLRIKPVFTCPVSDMNVTGTYPITPSGADAGANYTITYQDGTLSVQEERIEYRVDFELMGHGEDIPAITAIKAGEGIVAPQEPQAEGYIFKGWFKDRACTKEWNFATDTVQEDIVLYACWIMEAEEEFSFHIQAIPNQSYIGSAIKPSVRVYTADGSTLLKAGRDYVIRYYNNVDADTEEERVLGGISYTGVEGNNGFTNNLAYVMITGKGDYTGNVYMNFHIEPINIGDGGSEAAEGITIRYNEQLVSNSRKDQKPISSVRYKKTLKYGTDYSMVVTAVDAVDENNEKISCGEVIGATSAPVIPAGYKGTFSVGITGIGNFTGSVNKLIYVADRNHLLKNASISLGKNQKRISYQDGKEVRLTSGYYDSQTKKYFSVNADGTLDETPRTNANDLFTVKVGDSYLLYGKDYVITYDNNIAVGKAKMTIVGIGDYTGSKSVGFNIIGKEFNRRTIAVDDTFKDSVVYNGKPQTQNKVVLTDRNGCGLEYGTHYYIQYSDNVNKGIATMRFVAKPEAGYTGNFSKEFVIEAASLSEVTQLTAVKDGESITGQDGLYTLAAEIPYEEKGCMPSDRICLVNSETGVRLVEGRDYTVSYANNKKVTAEGTAIELLPTMTVTGTGNYTGSLKIVYTITKASFANSTTISAVAVPTQFDVENDSSYQYNPVIWVRDGDRVLTKDVDYTVEYLNCSHSAVNQYLIAISKGTVTGETLEQMKPKAKVSTINDDGYLSGEFRVIELPIYQSRLTVSQMYVVIDDKERVYKGESVCPAVDVYYGDYNSVIAAKKGNVTDEELLTNGTGIYKLTKLSLGSDYTVQYGENNVIGKNKGSVTVIGNGLYGRCVTTRFTILESERN